MSFTNQHMKVTYVKINFQKMISLSLTPFISYLASDQAKRFKRALLKQISVEAIPFLLHYEKINKKTEMEESFNR